MIDYLPRILEARDSATMSKRAGQAMWITAAVFGIPMLVLLLIA